MPKFDFSFVEFGLVSQYPSFLTDIVARMKKPRQFPEVLARMKEVDDLNGAGKVFIGDIPDPFGPVADDYFCCRTAPAAVPCFQVYPLAEVAGRFDCAGVGR